MIIYFKGEQSYDYHTGQPVDNIISRAIYNIFFAEANELDIDMLISYMNDNQMDSFTMLCTTENLSVNYGDEDSIDMDVCEEHNVQLFHENRQGGAIVMFPGNIAFHDIRRGNTFLFHYNFMDEFTEWLRSKGLDATTSRNDIMVDGKKVAGAIVELYKEHPNIAFFGSVVSVNADVELIDKICTKEMVKVPGALSDYGITTEEVIQFVLEWFNQHSYDGEVR